MCASWFHPTLLCEHFSADQSAWTSKRGRSQNTRCPGNWIACTPRIHCWISTPQQSIWLSMSLNQGSKSSLIHILVAAVSLRLIRNYLHTWSSLSSGLIQQLGLHKEDSNVCCWESSQTVHSVAKTQMTHLKCQSNSQLHRTLGHQC